MIILLEFLLLEKKELYNNPVYFSACCAQVSSLETRMTNKKVVIAPLVCTELSTQYNYIFQLLLGHLIDLF